MKNFTRHTLALAASFLLVGHASAQLAQTQPIPEVAKTIEATYRADMLACDPLAGNAKDICKAHAKGQQRVATAELDARRHPSAKATYHAAVVAADAAYAEASQKCDDEAGNPKDVCMQEAKAARKTAKADATAKLKSSQARKTSRETTAAAKATAKEEVSDAQNKAHVAKREGQYSVAKEKCDRLAGDAKDQCLEKAKTDFGPL
jgi:predicted ribonuclease toxin of YeeF-YezG toxin-antitoxin module